MKIRQCFISNSSSSSFILKTSKPIEEYAFEEFKNCMQLDSRQFKDCKNVDVAIQQLLDAVVNGKLTDLDRFKGENTYQFVLGDLSDMEDTEIAYELVHDYPSLFVESNDVKIANNEICLIDLGVEL